MHSEKFCKHLEPIRATCSYFMNHNRKLEISTATTKAKSWEPAYSQALIQNKNDRQRVRSRESGRQTDSYVEWCLELRRGGK